MENQEVLMNELNKFTRRTLSADEVYIFDLVLCDNEIDRDGDCFTDDALAALEKRFVGVTGIFDHDPHSSNQTARIFRTELLTDPERKTAAGKPYRFLKANAYMIRTAGNADLIREIDGGIKKEVSVSCAVSEQVCSVCGANLLQKRCAHIKGRSYAGRKCFTLLGGVTDVYEWSFVAVPAQRGAGVTKKLGGLHTDPEKDALRASLDAANRTLDRLTEAVRRDVVRLCYARGENAVSRSLAQTVQHLDADELLTLRGALSAEKAEHPASQLGGTAQDAPAPAVSSYKL